MSRKLVFAQQIKPFIYQLVDENGIICDADGNHVVHPIQFVGHAEEQLEFLPWKGDNETDSKDE